MAAAAGPARASVTANDPTAENKATMPRDRIIGPQSRLGPLPRAGNQTITGQDMDIPCLKTCQGVTKVPLLTPALRDLSAWAHRRRHAAAARSARRPWPG